MTCSPYLKRPIRTLRQARLDRIIETAHELHARAMSAEAQPKAGRYATETVKPSKLWDEW